ncbi:MAG: hypothetical protein D8M25_12080 [Bacteroidetes bacterium]|nr:hypothetical protein [Bacteroidota bacterium]
MKAQNENVSLNKLKNLANSAKEYKDYKAAVSFYTDYLNQKPEDLNIQFELAECYRYLRDYSKAANSYEKLINSEKNKNKLAVFYLANMYRAQGKCALATPLYDQFRKDYRGEKNDRKYIKLAKNAIEGCQLPKDNKSEDLFIEGLGSDINGEHMEASPIYLSENKLLYNSLKLNGENSFELDSDSLPQRKFYLAQKDANETWVSAGVWVDNPIIEGTQIANGAFNFDGTKFYFSACKTMNSGKVTCDLYGLKIDTKEIELLPKTINSNYTETQVAVGKDSKERDVIYFVSDRKEGKGGLDIWYSIYDAKKNTYKEARNCGSKINSIGDEMTPTINPRNRKLYFSSNGHPGYGELDVFMSAGEKSKWSEPENLGVSINSGYDELYYTESKEGSGGFFVSNRTDGNVKNNATCCDDLFSFKNKVTLVRTCSGKVMEFSTSSSKPLKNAKIRVYQLDESNQERFLVQETKTDENGDYKVNLDPNQKYVITAENENYFRNEETINTFDYKTKSAYSKNFQLNAITNQAIVIENIYYKFDKAELTEVASNVIDTTIYPMLINNPEIVVEISSHTDSKGSKGYNLKLSQERAESVVKYLKKKGIAKERLQAKGYGMAKPIALNKNADGSDNPEGRAKNRRTEFKVIGKIKVFEDED